MNSIITKNYNIATSTIKPLSSTSSNEPNESSIKVKAGEKQQPVVNLKMFNTADQLVADNDTLRLDANGKERRDVLQLEIIDGKPTGKLRNATGNALVGRYIFWTIDDDEGSTNLDLKDAQIEMGNVDRLLKNENDFKKFRKRYPSYSDTEIRDELLRLQGFQKRI